jgi:hypothetical protein
MPCMNKQLFSTHIISCKKCQLFVYTQDCRQDGPCNLKNGHTRSQLIDVVVVVDTKLTGVKTNNQLTQLFTANNNKTESVGGGGVDDDHLISQISTRNSGSCLLTSLRSKHILELELPRVLNSTRAPKSLAKATMGSFFRWDITYERRAST